MMLQMHFEERGVYAKGGSELGDVDLGAETRAIWQGGVNWRIHSGAIYKETATSCISVLSGVE